MSLVDVDDIVTGFSDEKVAGAFRRVCEELGLDGFEQFDFENPEHYEVFENELKLMAVDHIMHDLHERDYLVPDYVDDDGRVVYKRTRKALPDGP